MMSMEPRYCGSMNERYTHGHHASVLRSHRWRTAANSAAYLLGRLTTGQDLLDVGCGPGTITRDFGRIVAPGMVVGVDSEASVIHEAVRDSTEDNVTFQVGDVYALPYEDCSFDVVHAHQLLQHLADPVAALIEMRRVLRPGGILAVRDADFAGFVWYPADVLLDRWLRLYHEITARNGAQADAGRRLLSWVQQAGFTDTVMTSATWTFADPEARLWWGGLWADRVELSDLAKQAVDYELSTSQELAAIADAFRRWASQPDGAFIVPHGQVVALKS